MAKKSAIQERYDKELGNTPTGRFRMIFNHEHSHFHAYAVRTDDETIRKELAIPVIRVYQNGQKVVIDWTADRLIEALQPAMRTIHRCWGKNWILRIEQKGNVTTAPPTGDQPGQMLFPKPDMKSMPAATDREPGDNE